MLLFAVGKEIATHIKWNVKKYLIKAQFSIKKIAAIMSLCLNDFFLDIFMSIFEARESKTTSEKSK